MTEKIHRTPLHIALSQARDFEISRTLIKNGADLGNRDVEGKTPCHTFFNEAVGNILLSYKDDIDDLQSCDGNGMGIAHYAAWSSQSSYRHVLASIQPNDMRPFVARDHLGRGLIHLAAQRGNVEILRNLVDINFNGDIDCRDKEGRTALHYAVERKRTDVIKLLISRGSDVNALDSRGWTPLHRAAAKNNLLAIDFLTEVAGENCVGKVDLQSRTPEKLALQFGATAAARHLRDMSGTVSNNDGGACHVSRSIGSLEPRLASSFIFGLSSSLSRYLFVTGLWSIVGILIHQIALWRAVDQAARRADTVFEAANSNSLVCR